MANQQPLNRDMAREILNYFVRNPHAADTLEGVARWRLMDEMIRRKLDETEAALECLVGYADEIHFSRRDRDVQLESRARRRSPAIPRHARRRLTGGALMIDR